MEMPIGQQEMPLDASMWKGRKSGMRLPPYEVKSLGGQGSPVKGMTRDVYANPVNKKRQIDPRNLEDTMVQRSDNYNNQIANKRYVPKE
jgi:hypothetical protein